MSSDNGVWEDQQCIHRRFGSGLFGWLLSRWWVSDSLQTDLVLDVLQQGSVAATH